MRVRHELQMTARCPADGRPDVYRLTVRTGRTIPVEDILAAVLTATKEPAFQEAITQELHRLLAAEVETVGTHSGVVTTVVCG